MDHFFYLCFVFVMLSCLFIRALWSSAGKGAGLLVLLLCFYHVPMWCPGSGVGLDCIDS